MIAPPPDGVSLFSLDRYMAVDPASGREKRVEANKARQAMAVIAVDHLTRIFAVYAWAGRLPTDEFVDRIINVCELYSPRICAIEANGMQSLFADLVGVESRKRLKRLPIQPFKQPTTLEKDFRIRTILEPVINTGRLFILHDQQELIQELRGFPTARYKDLVDCLATAISLVPPRSTKASAEKEIRELAAFLRRSGLPQRAIEQRIEEIRRESEEIIPLWREQLSQTATLRASRASQNSCRPF